MRDKTMKMKNNFGFISGLRQSAENGHAQRDSGISILKTSPTGLLTVRLVPQSGDPSRPLDFKTSLAQRDSGISNLGAGVLGILRILGGKTVRQGVRSQKSGTRMGTENRKNRMRPAQQDSEMSILTVRPLCPYCPYCPLVLKTAPRKKTLTATKP